jgi:creatinine amidohydrolase
VFPDLTRKPWGSRLGDEFRSGACHAGQFETSIVLREKADAVRDEVRQSLAPNPQSLSNAIKAGKRTFEAAGGPRAYFGDPAAATGDEGARLIEALGSILEEAVRAEI